MKRQGQGGLTHIHLVVFLLVIALAHRGLMSYQMRQLSETRGKVVGGMQRNILQAVNDYLKVWSPKIVAVSPTQDITANGITVANKLAPTLAELTTLGHLHATVTTPPHGGSWVISITTAAGCTLPDCNLEAVVYATAPLTVANNPARIDSTALDAAIAEIGADGGYSDLIAPNLVTGAGGWVRANPNGAVAGTVLSIGGYGSTSYTALRNVGEACTVPGAVATATTGQQLICRGGFWVTTLNALPSYRVGGLKQLVKDGDVIAKPVCEPGGTPSYSFEMTQTTVDVAIAPPLQSQYTTMDDLGTNWRVKIHLKDKNTTDVTANTYNITAILHLECYYP